MKRTYYVDSILGNDGNSGLTAEMPIQSMNKINGLVLRPGDEVRFKCGGKWKEMLCPKGNGTEFAPVLISSYGEGEKPEIDGNGVYAGVLLDGVSHYILENLKVTNKAVKRAVRQGICIRGKALGVTENITIRECEICEVCGENRRARESYHSMYWNGAVYVTMPGRSSCENHLHHIRILNNYIHDVWTGGIRVNQEEDFINDIHHTCVVVRGNRIERTGTDGIIVANCISPLIDENVCYDAGFNGSKDETMLIAGIWVCAVSDALIRRNEVARTRLFQDDGTAFDTDWGTCGTIVFEYNYSHDNEGGFWLDCSSFNYNTGYEKTILRYNVSLRDGRGIAVGDKGLPAEFYGNVFAFDEAARLCVWEDGRDFLFQNNAFYFGKEISDHWGKAFLNQNYYESDACSRDRNAKKECTLKLKVLLEQGKDGRDWLQDIWPRLCQLVWENELTNFSKLL